MDEIRDPKIAVNEWLKTQLGKDLPVRAFSVRFEESAQKQRGYQIDFVVFYVSGLFAGGFGFDTASAHRRDSFRMVSLPIPFKMSDLGATPDYIVMKEISEGLSPTEAAACSPTNYKIGVFMALYKKQFGVDYKLRGGDNNWAKAPNTSIPANVDEINCYLTTNEYPMKGNKCITDYLKHYNAVLQLIANTNKENKCPDEWDAAYYTACWDTEDKSKLHEYVRHLKSMGYEKSQTNTGKTIYIKHHE